MSASEESTAEPIRQRTVWSTQMHQKRGGSVNSSPAFLQSKHGRMRSSQINKRVRAAVRHRCSRSSVRSSPGPRLFGRIAQQFNVRRAPSLTFKDKLPSCVQVRALLDIVRGELTSLSTRRNTVALFTVRRRYRRKSHVRHAVQNKTILTNHRQQRESQNIGQPITSCYERLHATEL